jgi:small subunit ribosomal protein S19
VSRSLKKGPFVHPSLHKKIEEMNKKGEKRVIKSWSRASMIVPDMIGHTIAIYNGQKRISHGKQSKSQMDKDVTTQGASRN